jgi:hypothetical protein
MAISNMPEDFSLKSFLLIHRAEVNEMLLTEYNEAEVMELFEADGWRKGHKEGREEGQTETLSVFQWLFQNGRAADVERATNDPDFYAKLLEEYQVSMKKA